MTWYWAVLTTLGVILFWPAYVVGGDWLDKQFQAWQSRRLQDGVAELRAERLAREKAGR